MSTGSLPCWVQNLVRWDISSFKVLSSISGRKKPVQFLGISYEISLNIFILLVTRHRVKIIQNSLDSQKSILFALTRVLHRPNIFFHLAV
jgi:hypothetical protein